MLIDELLKQPEFSKRSRLPSLFSDFSRLSETNRDGYEANVKAWTDALSRSLLSESLDGSKLCLVADSALGESLTSSTWGRPLSLGVVEAEARKKGAWVPLDSFLSRTESIYEDNVDSGLFSRLTIGSVLRWGFAHLWSPPSSTATRTKLTGESYVCRENLERVSRSVRNLFEMQGVRGAGGSYSDYITTVSALRDRIAAELAIHLDPRDMTILLRHLERDSPSLAHSGDVIRLYPDSTSTRTRIEPITETDMAISQVKSTLAQQQRQLDLLTANVEECKRQIASALAHSQKTLALSALRSKRTMEASLSKTLEMHHQLTTLLHGIDDAASHLGIIQAMKSGSAALSGILRQIGSIDSVDNLMDGVRQQLDETAEIGDSIGRLDLSDASSSAALGGGEEDAAALEEEWNRLVTAAMQEQLGTSESESAAMAVTVNAVDKSTTLDDERQVLEARTRRRFSMDTSDTAQRTDTVKVTEEAPHEPLLAQ